MLLRNGDLLMLAEYWARHLLLSTLHTLAPSSSTLFFAIAVICLIGGIASVLFPLLQLILHVSDGPHIHLQQQCSDVICCSNTQ